MTYNGIDFNGTSGGSTTSLQYWCNFTASAVWKQQQRLLLLCKNNNSRHNTLAIAYPGLLTVEYKLSYNNYIIIDISDIIRTYGDASLTMRIVGDAAVTLAITVAGLINPARLIIPIGYDYAYIIPPTMMYSGVLFDDMNIIAELQSYTTTGWRMVSETTMIQPIDPPSVYIPYNFQNFYVQRASSSTTRFYRSMRVRDICEDVYAMVRWVSVTGVTRQHLFVLRKHTIETGDTYQLQRIDGALNEVKGRRESVTLFLDELNAYDYWYYSDILTSSKVEILLEIGQSWKPIIVKDTEVTIPDGNSFDGKLEMNAIIEDYDAVIM